MRAIKTTEAKTLHRMQVVQAVLHIRFDQNDFASSADSRMDFSVGKTYNDRASACLMNGPMMPSLMRDSSAELTSCAMALVSTCARYSLRPIQWPRWSRCIWPGWRGTVRRYLRMIGYVVVANFKCLGKPANFVAQLLHRCDGIGVGRNQPGGNPLGVMGIDIKHEKKLAEKTACCRHRKAIINLARQLRFSAG